jgi:hypothetical protein
MPTDWLDYLNKLAFATAMVSAVRMFVVGLKGIKMGGLILETAFGFFELRCILSTSIYAGVQFARHHWSSFVPIDYHEYKPIVRLAKIMVPLLYGCGVIMLPLSLWRKERDGRGFFYPLSNPADWFLSFSGLYLFWLSLAGVTLTNTLQILAVARARGNRHFQYSAWHNGGPSQDGEDAMCSCFMVT